MSESSPTIIDRDAARIVLLDRHDRVLLFRCEEPGADRSFWITPGGGLKPGESHETAALRELREETGLVGVELGPCVWTRTHTFPWLGQTYRQRERFFLLRVDGHEIDRAGHTAEERQVLIEHRWWSAQQIKLACEETFAPRTIGLHIEQLLIAMPDDPIDVGA